MIGLSRPCDGVRIAAKRFLPQMSLSSYAMIR
nr:MAG TPA: hypothetical protein [Caudoviricetes sp.]